MVFLVMDDIFDADSSKEVMFGVPIFDQIMEYIACETKANIFNSGMLSTGILSGRCVCVCMFIPCGRISHAVLHSWPDKYQNRQ